jgi:hypothetical protein
MGTLVAKVTMTAIKELEPGDEVRDSDLKGFGVRRQAGAISYFVHTRIKGKLKRITIGKHGSPWTPEKARQQAAVIMTSIRSGGDPARERDDDRVKGLSFGEVAERFLDVHGAKLKPRTVAEYSRMVRQQLGDAFGSK